MNLRGSAFAGDAESCGSAERAKAAERRTQPFAVMSRLGVFGVPRAQTLAVFTLTEAIPGLVGWRELFANRPVGGVRTGHNLLASAWIHR